MLRKSHWLNFSFISSSLNLNLHRFRMDFTWICTDLAWIWEITYQLTLLEWRLAWYWAIYLPWAGFPNQFLRNSISKRGKFIDLRSKLRSFTVIYGILTVFQSQQNWLNIHPCFLQCFAEHPPRLRLIRPDINCNSGFLYNGLKSLKASRWSIEMSQ